MFSAQNFPIKIFPLYKKFQSKFSKTSTKNSENLLKISIESIDQLISKSKEVGKHFHSVLWDDIQNSLINKITI